MPDLNNSPNKKQYEITKNSMKTSADSSAQASSTPSLTLKDAVINTVKELKAKGSISIHDVTTEIRKAVNAGEFILPGLENPNPSEAGIKYWVKNEDVKAIIENLENDGTLATLGLTDVDYSGPYRVYKFSTTDSADDNGAVAIAPTSDSSTDPTQSPLVQRIKAYLSRGTPVTIKQIQSALKVNGVTCEDLVNIVGSIGDYVVTPGTLDCYYSTYTVEEQ